MTMRPYLRSLAIGFLVLLAAAAGFTRLIDPYDYWGGPVIAGFNLYKPAADKHVEAVKLRQAARVRPTTIIAGNSRVDVGFDPNSPAWPRDARPVYNLGVPGIGTEQVVDAVIETMDRTRPRQLILAVDFLDFPLTLQEWRSWNATPAVRTAGMGGLRETVEVLLSLDAIGDSVAAIAEQHRANPAHITPQGFNTLANYNDNVATEGHAALFEQRHRDNIVRYLARPKAVRWPGPGGSDDWAALERIARECRRRGVALTLITTPYHVDLLLAFQRTGLWSAFEDWQRGLAEFGTRHAVPLWDFAQVRSETIESVPARGDTSTRMRWYWEAGHFKASLGTRVIQELFGAPASIGVRLTSANVERTIEERRRALIAYRAARPADAARFDHLFAQVSSAPPIG